MSKNMELNNYEQKKRWQQIVTLSLLLVAMVVSNKAISGEAILNSPFTSENALKGWTINRCKATTGAGGITLILQQDEMTSGTLGIYRRLPIAQLRGKRVKFSIDVRAEQLSAGPQAKYYHGGKFTLEVSTPGKKLYPNGKIAYGNNDWKRVEFTSTIPFDATSTILSLGFQNAYGLLNFRNLRIEITDTNVDLSKVVNMGFADKVAGDGKGGWSDQGRDNDARKFNFRKKKYGGVPFAVLDPSLNQGKSVLVMRSQNAQFGLESVEVPVTGGGRNLYLLHTLTWGGKKGVAGIIEAFGGNGEKQRIEVVDGRDVTDWWHTKRLSNGWPGAAWPNSGGQSVGMHVSRFSLDFVPNKLVFRSVNGRPVWIIAGALLSDRKYEPVENAKYIIKEGKEWQALKRSASEPRVVPGSVLDMSSWTPKLPLDRLIVNKNGDFAFKGNPDKAVRFFCASSTFFGRGKPWGGKPQLPPMFESNFDTYEKIDAFVEEMYRQGYNMYRVHCTNSLIGGMENGQIKFKSDPFDKIQYLIAKCKSKNIYIMLDLLSREVGFTGVSQWGNEAHNMQLNLNVYFDETARKHCLEGIRLLLTQKNPYTGTRLIDDPILALITAWNEQEFAFIKNYNYKIAAPEFAKFLSRKYKQLENVNQAWETSFVSLDQAAQFNIKDITTKNRRGADISEFITSKEKELSLWYGKELNDLGYPGLLTNYDMTKSLHYVAMRQELDVVSIHNYQNHPTRGMHPGSSMNVASDLAGAAKHFRQCAATRIAGKPMVVNEYAQLWWTPYRYEEAFGFAAYAAMNNFGSLTRHAHPVATVPSNYIGTWESFWDPIVTASQVATSFLFIREDVAPAKNKIRLQFSAEGARRDLIHRDYIDATQSRLSLITGFGMENIDADTRPVDQNEVVIPLAGSSAAINNLAGFSESLDQDGGHFDLSKAITTLKQRGVLNPDNKSDGWNVFENDTEELLLDTKRSFMAVDTPRFQGICALADTTAELKDVTIKQMTTAGHLSVISLDGNVSSAKRLLVIYATDAQNTNTTFEDRSMSTIVFHGTNPTLIKTGIFTLTLNNSNAAKFKAYPLGMSGKRRAAIPVSVSNGVLTLEVNTAALTDGPALYFELVVE